ncbi:hypothetical protein R70723_28730 [Paenibacillus sp. FSL R7-0273]|nr:hypothetical protein R70723_28730 [Paenibacillus sp. FSL R7-0273]
MRESKPRDKPEINGASGRALPSGYISWLMVVVEALAGNGRNLGDCVGADSERGGMLLGELREGIWRGFGGSASRFGGGWGFSEQIRRGLGAAASRFAGGWGFSEQIRRGLGAAAS